VVSSIQSNGVQNSAIATRSATLLVSGVSSGPHSGANALDTVKFFTSIKWKPKFEDVAAQFAAYKSDLHVRSATTTSITGSKTSSLVASVDDKMTTMTAMMELVFERLQTPRKENWLHFRTRTEARSAFWRTGYS
jgi:hypothetical protein